jgi:hypothetical protein
MCATTHIGCDAREGSFVCHCWIGSDLIATGTSDGRVIIYCVQAHVASQAVYSVKCHRYIPLFDGYNFHMHVTNVIVTSDCVNAIKSTVDLKQIISIGGSTITTLVAKDGVYELFESGCLSLGDTGNLHAMSWSADDQVSSILFSQQMHSK